MNHVHGGALRFVGGLFPGTSGKNMFAGAAAALVICVCSQSSSHATHPCMRSGSLESIRKHRPAVQKKKTYRQLEMKPAYFYCSVIWSRWSLGDASVVDSRVR